MKLLIVTQIVDTHDQALGFFHAWIVAFAEQVEEVKVICLYEREHSLPANVSVYSLGKRSATEASTLLNRIRYSLRFISFIWSLRRSYDSVFVHMNSEYVLLGAPLWKLRNNRVGLWYVHRSIPWHLRVAEQLVDFIFTASNESFRLATAKRLVTGHGIETSRFDTVRRHQGPDLRLVTVGRITSIKNIHAMIDTMRELKNREIRFDLAIYGAPVTVTDEEYVAQLRTQIERHALTREVHFEGSVMHSKLPETLSDRSAFLNLSPTGSLDKAVLEALASGLPVVTSNESFRTTAGLVFVQEPVPKALADAIVEAAEITENLPRMSAKQHDLKSLISKIIKAFQA